ncbi:stage III sporulation protein AH [Paenibacillus shirakamiensis]|uniref:Stage III sporulation protein AH n=1 Tax=Paenibacillus shirakamiensis TaxID=1265935 RepID=A0ABS4JEP4_9BACL|nr:SpoIIIAH-like family protein [Paenibacillus shirakamiensis]MBP1999436.1 stage III sporulation protein AH [Paenibacillus shirakamiensis]
MKSNRQTIWLVSMLSLMVILSAYYLFTEDSGPTAKTPRMADGQQVMNQDANTTKTTALNTKNNDVIATEITDSKDTTSTDSKVTDNKKDTASTTEDSSLTATDPSKDKATKETTKDSSKDTTSTTTTDPSQQDEEVLKKIEAQGAAATDNIKNYQYERQEKNNKLSDKLTQTIADQSKPLDESAKAQNDLAALSDKEAKIEDIELKLKEQFSDAVVTEDNNQYTVVVVSDKLEAKQAVSILDLVIKDLGVTQDKVKVQYVKQ